MNKKSDLLRPDCDHDRAMEGKSRAGSGGVAASVVLLQQPTPETVWHALLGTASMGVGGENWSGEAVIWNSAGENKTLE